jgi:hypothetical protein
MQKYWNILINQNSLVLTEHYLATTLLDVLSGLYRRPPTKGASVHNSLVSFEKQIDECQSRLTKEAVSSFKCKNYFYYKKYIFEF